MGRLSKILDSFIGVLTGSGAPAQFITVEEFAGDERKAQVFGPCNEDFAPPLSVNTLNSPLGRDRAFLTSYAYNNPAIAPVATFGERRLYATDQAGSEVMGEMFMHSDGQIVTENEEVTETLEPSGTRTVENLLISERMGFEGNRTITNLFVTENMFIDGSRTVENLLIEKSMGNDGLYTITVFLPAVAVPPLPALPVIPLEPVVTIKLTPEGEVVVDCGNVTITALETVKVEAADVEIISETLTHNGVNVGWDHVHPGVTTGNSVTEGPQ